MIEEEKEEIIQQDDMSADLSAAWEETEDEVIEDGTDEPVGEQSESVVASESTDATDVPAVEGEDAAKDSEVIEGTADLDTPPSSLPPAAREAWKDVPKVVQEAVAKREAEYSAEIKKHWDNSKRAEGMDRMLQPYQQVMQVNGGPGRTIKTLLDVASAMQLGAPNQKAQTVANLIAQFGVDISALDNILSGQQAQADPAQDMRSIAQQEAQKMFQAQQEQQQAVQNQQLQGEIGTELQQFAQNNEFYEDVRVQMGLLMKADSDNPNTGPMSVQSAYDMACQINPQVAEAIKIRTAGQSIAGKRKAAVSISGSPGGPGEGAAIPATMEEQLSAAWDAQTQMR
jgi:hypothetical protein